MSTYTTSYSTTAPIDYERLADTLARPPGAPMLNDRPLRADVYLDTRKVLSAAEQNEAGVPLMGLSRIGPVLMDHRNPSLDWTSPGNRSGLRTCRISGQSSRASVRQLSELTASGTAVQTVAGHVGVLDYVELTGELVGAYRGWYLLAPFDVQIQRPWDVTPFTPFSLDAVYLGDNVEVVIEAESQTMPNDFGAVGSEAIYDYFDGYLVVWTLIERVYDPSFPHSTGDRSEPAA